MSLWRPIILRTGMLYCIAAELKCWKCRAWNSHGHVSALPMAISDGRISAVRLLTVLWLNDTLYSECLKKWIRNVVLGTGWYNFQPPTGWAPRCTASQTDEQIIMVPVVNNTVTTSAIGIILSSVHLKMLHFCLFFWYWSVLADGRVSLLKYIISLPT